ncbi:TonB-dependent receptor plug domain-containing protein [Massilia antarctica]|uniref:TonB-dependent receptor plug domain-containing protein n=1 Tax=Massilia antarctica TaxID=2765360 RepID=UPI0006BB8BA0|nr:TonB-dependent receptor [Massilia sp. H27-R4]MCY0912248.1 TonB-dependent receptor [Massilia sp. H27-R4]CUI06256.1 TonB-dependent receptor; Outer membrane receptor for ferrienterochelin and colicins [Janthinobacterium sp. CG23_2]CUU30042.1 TonB-dependent receptor; Outer membrane receptor for ferrienterochelin and colicins [Janthinobacterium sp. CG23_2]
MQTTFAPKKHVLALSIAALFATGAAIAQDAAPNDATNTVVVTGTRVANRTALDTASPVDIISAESLKNSGTTEINQALAVALPSLNFPRPGLADGTDTIRPATLRGMAPDQTLVLVNSKRRHASSLVNVNGTIGRGSAAVDLNTIPTAIVKNIEVLRDGAAAQYGSDAISGVVNLRLRSNRDGGEATVNYGARVTEYDFLTGPAPANATWQAQNSRKRTDGQTATVSLWKGLALGETGYLTIAGEYKDQKHTERSGYDMRQQYALVNGAFDPRENTINRFNTWYGEPEMKQSTVFANAGDTLGNGVKIYGWASYQKREASSAGFFRWSNDPRNIPSIYPDGFMPIISPVVDDLAATGGASWSMGEWEMDASLGYGKNKMAFTIENTLNRSIGPSSKTSFDAGGFSYDQLVLNLTGVRPVALAALSSPLNVAVGAEARREGYALFAGEPDSYRFGGQLLPNGQPTAPGAQVFSGFRPQNESDTHRTAVGAFIDLEANITPALLTSFAIRGEHYSDFGSSLAGKLAGRYDFSKAFALRGSVQNGFRAPSPQQQNFTSTATNFITGVPFEITTFRPTDSVAIALGAKPLDAEKSVNASLGAVLRLGGANVTIDAYRIKVRDRIVLSENLTSADVRNFLTKQGFIGVGGGRFFINGVNTTTQGVDMVVNWAANGGAIGKFDFTVAGNFTKTEVTKVPATAQLAALPTPTPLFDRLNVLSLEQGQPKNKFNASTNWKLGQMGATLRATRYGKVLSPNASPALDVTLGAKTVVDLEGRYALTSKVNLAFGAENLFDKYPESVGNALNPSGNAPFPNYAAFGRGGRFVYARATYAF